MPDICLLKVKGKWHILSYNKLNVWIVKVLCVNKDKACISTELANLIYDKVEKNQELRIENTQETLSKPDKEEQQIELDKESGEALWHTVNMRCKGNS